MRLQAVLALNPDGIEAISADLAFNIAVSFVTNANWQAYAGEARLTRFGQMAGLWVLNFLSAATGRAAAPQPDDLRPWRSDRVFYRDRGNCR